MGHVVVDLELHHLGVHQDHLYFIRTLLVKDCGDKGVHAYRLSASGGSCNKEMRGLGHIHHLRVSFYVTPQDERHCSLVQIRVLGRDKLSESDDVPLLVRNLDTHCPLPGNRCYNTDTLGCQIEGYVVCQVCYLGYIDSRCRQDLEHCDDRTLLDAYYLGLYLEFPEGLQQYPGIFLGLLGYHKV